MGAVVELLEEYGLVRDQDCFSLSDFGKAKITELHERLYRTVRDEQLNAQASVKGEQGTDPFSFVAGRSIRAVGGCGTFDCRQEKLDFLGRYAALYADRVILPLPLQDPSNVQDKDVSVNEILHSVQTILRLRPLVDAEIVLPSTMVSFHACKHQVARAKRLGAAMLAVAGEMAKDYANEFRVKYQAPEKSPTGLSTLFAEGPEDFLEHGKFILVFREPKGWRPKHWKYDSDGMVELSGSRKVNFLITIFRGIADDTTFYLTYGRANNARYLSAQKGETLLLDLITERNEELSASSEAMRAYMAHTVPLLADLPLGALLRIRKEERDSFARYRYAVGRLLEDVATRKKRVGEQEIREVFRGQIEPELIKMKSELAQERKRQIRRIAGGAAAIAASVAFGAIGQVLPSAMTGAMATKLLGDAATSKCSHGASLKEKNDFYFLIRLSEEAEMAE